MLELSGRRFHKLFSKDERSVVIALDHGTSDGVLAGFEEPEQVLEQVLIGGADTILTSIGIARHYSKQLKDVGLIVRCDGATSPLLERPRALVISVEEILRAGADAAAGMYFPGTTNGHSSTIYFPRLASDAHRWNIPVMAEALPYGFEEHIHARSVDAVANTCRMAAENGADVIKTFYTGETESFRKVIRSCYLPVLVLGGPKTHSDQEFLASIRGALDAGAVGVVIGRNVWQSASPAGMTRALAALVHRDVSVDDAMHILHEDV